MNEQWKTVSGYEGIYEVSDYGRIRSLDRLIEKSNGRVCFWRSRLVKSWHDKKGYLQVGLCGRGRRKFSFVHRLVLASFCGESDLECNHRDGVKDNNYLANLEWVTSSENHLHRCRILGKGRGESHGRAKLTEKQVVEIRDRYKAGGVTKTELAKTHNVDRTSIRDLISRKTWHHVA